MSERLRSVAAQAILEAAEEVLAKDGSGARMDDIAARAGVAVGTLYNHFANRDALIEALLDLRRKELVSALADAAQRTTELAFAERLTAVLTAAISTAGPHVEFRRRMLEGGMAPTMKRQRELKKAMLVALEPLFVQGRAEKALADDPLGLQPRVLMGIFQALFFTALEEPRTLSLEALPEQCTRAFLAGAARRSR